ncbi:hypothetical protein VP01_2170g5 [Puccinia sorghi]|uniref:Sm domain-containing protein n=1 Tax=Puccinia sorghi TaxID=27349 RepID=A0A0L6V9M1_9BASI|nr:hypothetical protein VP01_2170g5 [Puccinia sorghi]
MGGQSTLEQLRVLLGQTVRVEIVDGRRLEGQFVCLDRPANLVLDNALESFPTLFPFNTRERGLVLLPFRHIRSIRAPPNSLIPSSPTPLHLDGPSD